MTMEGFDALAPRIAAAEALVFTLTQPRGRLAKGLYAVCEYYCATPGCDCTNVLLLVSDGTPNPVAAVNHSLAPGGFADIGEADWFLDPLHDQGPAAADALDIVEELTSVPENHQRLVRHRKLARAVIDARGPAEEAADGAAGRGSAPAGDRVVRIADLLQSEVARLDGGASAPGTATTVAPAIAWPHAVVPPVAEALAAIGGSSGPDLQMPMVSLRPDDANGWTRLRDTGSVEVSAGGRTALVTLPPVTALFRGTRRPSDFPSGPTPEYMEIFLAIERTARWYCDATGERIRDVEFQRIYDLLRRRPDAADPSRLHCILNAAIRLRMCLTPVSRDEFDAILRRLAKSARRLSDGPSSTNYRDIILAAVV